MRSVYYGYVLLMTCIFVFIEPSASAQAGLRATTSPDAAVTYQINARHNGAIQTKGVYPPFAVKWSVNLNATVWISPHR